MGLIAGLPSLSVTCEHQGSSIPEAAVRSFRAPNSRVTALSKHAFRPAVVLGSFIICKFTPFFSVTQAMSNEEAKQQPALCLESGDVVSVYHQCMEKFPDMAIAAAATQALTAVVCQSKATTIMELQQQIQSAIEQLTSAVQTRSSVSLNAGCQLFNRYVTRTSLDIPEFEQCKKTILERGRSFAQRSLQCRAAIAPTVARFLKNGATVLVQGRSRCVTLALMQAAKNGQVFNVVCVENRNDCSGYKVAEDLMQCGVNVTMVLDSAVACIMERVDLVLFGAEGVAESGGVINQIGSYQIAIVAKALNKPVYVAAESYKFCRIFPLSSADLPENKNDTALVEAGPEHPVPKEATMLNMPFDYTPPNFITLLFTDIGTFTPSAVSDELIKLWY